MQVRKLVSIILLAILFSVLSHAQVVYHDASKFTLIGKISSKTETRYERLPASLKDIVRKPVWNLGKNTAGLAIRFSTNSTSIRLKWSLWGDSMMSHMALTGIKGLDLYGLQGDEWIYVGTARPEPHGKENEKRVVSNMNRQEKEFMLYLPLYDGVTDIQIGIDADAEISDAKAALPSVSKPIVVYGTSIAQGGCASRPGMAYTNILSRWLNKEVINLGFSGNGLLDYEIAETMATSDASLYILDQMPNMSVELVNEKLETFYKIIRSKSPTTPIMFVEDPIFPASVYNQSINKKVRELNEALHIVFDRLRKDDSNIFLVSSVGMIGLDSEATVDGEHFTDLGFMRYAEYLLSQIKLLIKD